jgi:FG-GAP-like repeat/HYR domain
MHRKLLVLAGTLLVASSAVTITDAAALPHTPILAPAALVDATPSGPVTIGDVDADGTPDLVTSMGSAGVDAVAVHVGNGDGTFQARRWYASGTTGSSVAVGDLNNDAIPDLAVTNPHEDDVLVLPGPLPEPHTSQIPEEVPGAVLYRTGDFPASLAVGDLDHSGRLDLVVGNAEADTISVLLADQAFGFQSKVDYPAPNESIHTALTLADLDGDNGLDIVVADYASNTVSVLLGNLDGTFRQRKSFGADVLVSPVAVAVGDLNNDGVPDLVVGQQGNGVAVYLANIVEDAATGKFHGDGTFVAEPAGALPNEVRLADVASVAIADLNMDGSPEVVLGIVQTSGSPDPGGLAMLVGRGDGTFTEFVSYGFPTVGEVDSVAVGDLNLDGRPDLAATHRGALWTLFNQIGPYTSVVSTVVVVPVDPNTGATPVTITFSDVTKAGLTTVESSDRTEPARLFLQTTAIYEFAQACFSYTPPAAPTIARYDAVASAWTTPPQSDTGSAVCLDVTFVLQSFEPWAFVYTSGPSTPQGSNVVVNPLDPTTGTTPVTITFANVTVEGETMVTSSTIGPPVPSGFRLGSAYYELSTTAAFTGSVEVCFSYDGPPTPSIVHWVAGVSRIEPITRDTGTEVCAEVTEFSPFALLVPDSPDEEVEAPVIACGVADGAWHGTNVSIDCTAHDDGSGLSDAADAAFTLSTSVPDGVEDGDAATGTRVVCDVVGNCADAGPIGANKVDRKAPTLALPPDETVDATSSAGATVGFTVSASDRADPNPAVSCTPASGSTFAIGSTTVACTATDHIGNQISGSFTVTVLGAKAQLTSLIQDVISASKLPAAVKAQLVATLQPLVAGFDPANPAHRKAVCGALRAFTTALRLVSGHGVPPAQASAWIVDANRIRAVLAC